MRILFLTHDARCRLDPIVPRLEGPRISATVRRYRPLGLPSLVRAVGGHDVTVVQRWLPPRWILSMIRKRAARLIYDFDEAVFLRHMADGPRPGGARAARFAAMARAADVVVAGNGYLRGVAEAHGARRTELVPTVIDASTAPERTPHKGVVLGWAGEDGELDRIREALEGFTVVAWSDAAAGGIDVGLAPLRDDEWTRGECGTRLLRYAAAGVPAVADAVGVQEDIVVEGQTGFLVRTPQEWREKLRRLAAEPTLRNAMGVRARARVRERWSVDAAVQRWIPLLTSSAR